MITSNIHGNFICDVLRATRIDLYYIQIRGFREYISLTHDDCVSVHGQSAHRFIEFLKSRCHVNRYL